MKKYENASRQGSISEVIENVVSTSSSTSTENYANGMVLSYLDTLMSGNED
jgi:hypothetical protein